MVYRAGQPISVVSILVSANNQKLLFVNLFGCEVKTSPDFMALVSRCKRTKKRKKVKKKPSSLVKQTKKDAGLDATGRFRQSGHLAGPFTRS